MLNIDLNKKYKDVKEELLQECLKEDRLKDNLMQVVLHLDRNIYAETEEGTKLIKLLEQASKDKDFMLRLIFNIPKNLYLIDKSLIEDKEYFFKLLKIGEVTFELFEKLPRKYLENAKLFKELNYINEDLTHLIFHKSFIKYFEAFSEQEQKDILFTMYIKNAHKSKFRPEFMQKDDGFILEICEAFISDIYAVARSKNINNPEFIKKLFNLFEDYVDEDVFKKIKFNI